VSPEGQVLGPGEEGELTVEADIMFDGYLGDQALTGASFGEHGFRTGDLGRLDPAGYVYVTGRVKDLIISGGMNVYPAEVEAALAALPGVAECAVLGLPDERWGEAVTAVIVRAPGAELTEDQIITHVRTRIASYKRPQRVHFAAALPRNASMKVRKDQLRDQLAREGSPRARDLRAAGRAGGGRLRRRQGAGAVVLPGAGPAGHEGRGQQPAPGSGRGRPGRGRDHRPGR
jgi:acyl-CoA synthetase (AMP-forming)/AMP-acid ligase II